MARSTGKKNEFSEEFGSAVDDPLPIPYESEISAQEPNCAEDSFFGIYVEEDPKKQDYILTLIL